MKNITVGIKTFLRPEALSFCLESLVGLDVTEVIVADDNPVFAQDAYMLVYEKYQRYLPLRILQLPFDTGLAASRNSLVEATKTDYILILDDDHIVNHSISFMYDTLTTDNAIGGVSGFIIEDGSLRCTACNLFTEDGYIVKKINETPEIHVAKSGARYVLCDFIPSGTLFKRACLLDVPWDPHYKIGAEHLDFYVQHKNRAQWKFAVALDATIDHTHATLRSPKNTEYEEHRNGNKKQESWDYFKAKFNVHGKVEGYKLSDVLTPRQTRNENI